MMLNALRSMRTQPQTLFLANPIRCDASGGSVRLLQQQAKKNQDKNSMDKSKDPAAKTKPLNRDTMSSFGDGYATRSDEEGFGGIYGGNQYLNKEDEEAIKDGRTTPNDASQQGSEVKEKESARNQKNAATN